MITVRISEKQHKHQVKCPVCKASRYLVNIDIISGEKELIVSHGGLLSRIIVIPEDFLVCTRCHILFDWTTFIHNQIVLAAGNGLKIK